MNYHSFTQSNLPPPPPSDTMIVNLDGSGTNASFEQWEMIQPISGRPPCQRSLHAAAVYENFLLLFGGYDGSQRVNDLHAYNFLENSWSELAMGDNCPSPRDRHIAVVWENGFYVFGGFDGLTRVNDMHVFDLETKKWSQVTAYGSVPTPRHSHAAVVYGNSLYLFGGYDGSYRNDFHEFNFQTRTWSQVACSGVLPRARYRGTCVVHEDCMILHGGHDGSRHLQDTYVFNFTSKTWSELVCSGKTPSPRDSHISVVHSHKMYILGGSTGNAMGDFHELDLDTNRWSAITYNGTADKNNQLGGKSKSTGNMSSSNANTASIGDLPSSSSSTPSLFNNNSNATNNSNNNEDEDGSATGNTNNNNNLNATVTINSSNSAMKNTNNCGVGNRFCHIGVVHDSALYVFGGYDGTNRLNDFQRFQFFSEKVAIDMRSTLVSDLKKFVNNELLSDITFIVEGEKVYAHKLLCTRCPYFHNMLTGEYMESKAAEIIIEDVKYSTFIQFMEFLYTDTLQIVIPEAIDLFQIADRYSMDRLKSQCEYLMLSTLSVDTAAQIFLLADTHDATLLREKCLKFILSRFDQVSLSPGFEELAHSNVQLVMEIIQKRRSS